MSAEERGGIYSNGQGCVSGWPTLLTLDNADVSRSELYSSMLPFEEGTCSDYPDCIAERSGPRMLDSAEHAEV